MKSLHCGDTIPYGVYSGKKLGTVVKKYGRKVLLEIVKCNEVDDDYLKKYHYHHPATEEEKRNWELKQRQMVKEETSMSAPLEETYVTTVTDDMNEECQDQDACEMAASWKDSVLYDPEDDPYDSCYPYLSKWGDPYHTRTRDIS